MIYWLCTAVIVASCWGSYDITELDDWRYWFCSILTAICAGGAQMAYKKLKKRISKLEKIYTERGKEQDG